MNTTKLKDRDFENEFSFSASRSSGPGGQNINKVNTKVELRFDVLNSNALSNGEKELVLKKFSGKINNEGEIVLISQDSRSQQRNKEIVTEKFYLLISQALIPPKNRIKTKPSKLSREKRLQKKNIRSELKQSRKKMKK